MPTLIDIEPAVLRWQAKHNRRLTYEELAERASISIAALYRIKSGNMIAPDLRKINELCKVLECEPGDLIKREDTSQLDPATKRELERQEIINELDKPAKRAAGKKATQKGKSASAG